MKPDEVLETVRRLYAGIDDDEAVVPVVESLTREFPNANISDLIFWDFRGLTPEQVVEEAYRRQAEYAASGAGGPTTTGHEQQP